ncbi:MAG: DUF1579 domain-containing protein [Phycisphaerales bacterium]
MKIGQKQGWMMALVFAVGTAGSLSLAQDKVAKPSGERGQDHKRDHGQPEKTDAGAGGDHMDEMAQWANANKPNENHEALSQFVGTWAATTKFWMDPSQPPMESKATLVATPTMGGRYVTCAYSGDFAGQPFQGVATWAYNNATKQFESTWIDSMSTGISFSTGQYDKASKTWTMAGKMPGPDGNEVITKEVSQITSKDTFVMKMYMVMSDGSELQNAEITYTRIPTDSKGAMKHGENMGEKTLDKAREKANDAKDKGEKKLRDTLPR